MTGRDQIVAPGKLDPVQPFECHHPPGRALPVDLWDVEIIFGDHVLLELGRRGGLAAEVQFAPGPLAEMGDDHLRTKPLSLAPQLFSVRRSPFIGLERSGEFFLDPGAEDLDRDIAALGRNCTMDLGDRGGPDRDFVEAREEGFERSLERLLDRRANGGKGSRGERVLKAQEIVRRLVADQVRAGRERLTELDRSGPDFLKRMGIVGLGRLSKPEPGQPKQAADAGRSHRIALDPLKRAMAGERPAPFQ